MFRQLWKEMPLWFKVLFVVQFALYGLVVYVVIHFITKFW